MSVALARVYTYTHTKVGRFTVILGAFLLLVISLMAAYKLNNDGDTVNDVSQLFAGANSFAIFVVGMGMMIFQSSEYGSGGMPYMLMRVPDRKSIAKANLAAIVTIAIGFASVVNVVVATLTLTLLYFKGTLQTLNYSYGTAILMIVGIPAAYFIVGTIAFSIGDIAQGTAAGVVLYSFVYWLIPLAGALITSIHSSLGSALVNISLAANVEKLLAANGTEFIGSLVAIGAWAGALYIVGFLRFRGYTPR